MLTVLNDCYVGWLKTFWLILSTLVVSCSGNLFAQRFIDSVDEIPTAGFQDAFAYYDGTTGDIYLSIGESQTSLGIGGADLSFNRMGEFDDSLIDQGTPLGAPTYAGPSAGFYSISWRTRPDFLPTGIFNIGPLLPAGIMLLSDFEREYPDLELRFSDPSFGGVTKKFGIISTASLAIPEPVAATAIGISALLSLMRRRRCELELLESF